MAIPTALTATQLDTCRTGHFGVDQYMLFWDQEIIFQAQVNQAVFADSFASLTYDNVTVGAYTAIKSDFICYVSVNAGDILNPEHVFRVRADGAGAVASSTVLNINETSASITNDWYIMVVKDVRCEAKQPKAIVGATPASNSYSRDYAITFRRLLPIIYGLQTAYVNPINSSGVADFVLAPSVLITDADASATTWLWDLDGMAFQVGSSSTASITARATVPGQYLPRVWHTDSLGNANYFTFRVFVPPADLSSVVNLATTNPRIQRDTVNGHTLSLSANAVQRTGLITRIDQYPDETFVAVWWKTNQPTITSTIAFVGWITAENLDNTFGSDRNSLYNTQFTVDGISGRLGDTISRRIPMVDDTAPSVFGEIENLTPWRAAAYFLTEHSTLTNICSVQFDDTGDDYRFPRFGSSDSSVLDSLTGLMFTINGGVNFFAAGEISIDRIAWFLNASDRNALTTVANFTTTDMATGEQGGLLFALSRAHIPIVGREMSGGGIFNTGTGDIQLLKALTPAVVQSQGNQLATFNRQILTANSSLAAGEAELGQRGADDMAARQPQTLLTVIFPPAYSWLNPSRSQWYTWTIASSDNNRGVSFTTATRWTLRSVSLGHNAQAGTVSVQGVFQKETQGGSFQTAVTQPLDGTVIYFNPVTPTIPVYSIYPPDPQLTIPDPANPTEEDEPPFDASDSAPWSVPQDPALSAEQYRSVGGPPGMVWDDDSLWGVENIPNTPTYTDYTPSNAGTITNGKFDPFGPRALAISNDGINTLVHRTKSFGDLQWVDTEVLGTLYTKLLPTQVIDKVYVLTQAGGAILRDTFNVQGANSSYTDGSWVMAIGTTYLTVITGFVKYGSFPSYASAVYSNPFDDWTYPGTVVGPGNNARFQDGGLLDADDTTFNPEHSYSYTRAGADVVESVKFQDSAYGDNSGNWVVYVYEVPAAGGVQTVYSENFTETFAALESVGVISGSESGSDTKRGSAATTVYVAVNDSVERANNGSAYVAETDGGDTTGTYAKAIVGFEGDGNPYVFGTAAALGGETMFVVDNGSRTAITPNDGADNGIVVGQDALAMSPQNDQIIFALCDFGGTVKMAYTADQGLTWQFNTQVTSNAIYIRCKDVEGTFHIVIADGASLWWGSWTGTGAITLHEKGSPSTALKGVELL